MEIFEIMVFTALAVKTVDFLIFSQLLDYQRDTKYDPSMEQAVNVIEKYCTFPRLEKIKFFRLTLFNFLVGNEDMHMKNFSLIRRKDKVELSPVYDLVNTTIVIKAVEEIALPMRGKKNKLNKTDFFDYFGEQRLGLSKEILEDEKKRFTRAFSDWLLLLDQSFLSVKKRESYLSLLHERWKRMF